MDDGLLEAAKGGHEHLFTFFITENEIIGGSRIIILGAAWGGHKELAIRHAGNDAFGVYAGVCGAARGGHKELIDFFISKGVPNQNWWDSGLVSALWSGRKDLVDFFIEKGGKLRPEATRGMKQDRVKEVCDYIEKRTIEISTKNKNKKK